MREGRNRFTVVGGGEGGTAAPPPGGKSAGLKPARRPRCPRDFTPEQRIEWFNILKRLEERGLPMDHAEGDMRALAVFQADFAALNEFINVHGTTHTEPRRPYQCPACHGSGVQAKVRTKAKPGGAEEARPTGTPSRAACAVCRKRDREEIDAALLKGISLRQLVGQYGTSRMTLHRHKTECLKAPSDKPTDRPCKGCRGTGVREGGQIIVQYPQVARRDVAASLIQKLSAALGLDNVNLVRAGGRRDQPAGPTALQELVARRGLRK